MNSHNKADGFERRLEVGYLAFHLILLLLFITALLDGELQTRLRH